MGGGGERKQRGGSWLPGGDGRWERPKGGSRTPTQLGSSACGWLGGWGGGRGGPLGGSRAGLRAQTERPWALSSRGGLRVHAVHISGEGGHPPWTLPIPLSLRWGLPRGPGGAARGPGRDLNYRPRMKKCQWSLLRPGQ